MWWTGREKLSITHHYWIKIKLQKLVNSSWCAYCSVTKSQFEMRSDGVCCMLWLESRVIMAIQKGIRMTITDAAISGVEFFFIVSILLCTVDWYCLMVCLIESNRHAHKGVWHKGVWNIYLWNPNGTSLLSLVCLMWEFFAPCAANERMILSARTHCIGDVAKTGCVEWRWLTP